MPKLKLRRKGEAKVEYRDNTVETNVSCPYCGEENTILVDESGGEMQQYIEDCQVCCKPWQVIVTTDDGGEVDVELRAVGA